jgi:lysophospholipase L1-like esterase
MRTLSTILVFLLVISTVFTEAGKSVYADHGTGSGKSFTFLESGFSQEIVGISSDFMGGIAFAPDGDVWVNDCSFSGSHLHRYDMQGVAPEVHGTKLHPETIIPSNAGCGMTNHPDGFIYSNTSLGAVQINASSGVPTGQIFGPAGNALGIAPDPQTGDVVYVSANCRFSGLCDIVTVDPETNASSVFVRLIGLQFIDGIFFSPDGSQLFLAQRSPAYAVTIVDRTSPGARTGTVNRSIGLPSEPDGIAFHGVGGFVVTANTDGTISKITLGADTVGLFASGGGRNDLSQVGRDTCLYTTQDNFTRYDDGTVTSQSSLVRICPGFVPPPGVTPEKIEYFALGDSIASGHGLHDTGEPCRRSTLAYPRIERDHLSERYSEVNFHHLACSGATATEPDSDTLALDESKWLHNQVNTVLAHAMTVPPDQPVLVSITIGANDFKWTNLWNFFHQLYWAKDSQFQNWLDRTTGKVHDALRDEVVRLLSVPNISVIITEVYNPFNQESVFFKFNPVDDRCGPLFTKCYDRAERATIALNSAIIGVYFDLGQPQRLQITPLSAAFHGHGAPRPSCGSAGPDLSDTWIQYKDDLTSNSFPEIPKKVGPNGPWYGDCFHPNIFGAQKIAHEVDADAKRLGL